MLIDGRKRFRGTLAGLDGERAGVRLDATVRVPRRRPGYHSIGSPRPGCADRQLIEETLREQKRKLRAIHPSEEPGDAA